MWGLVLRTGVGGVLSAIRAFGGCLGAKRRRRTWHAAKSRGEMRAIVDPRMSEWGNPPARVSYPEYIGCRRRTRGTETSQYLEEKTSTEIPLVVASERGLGHLMRQNKPNHLERWAIVGDSPVGVMSDVLIE
jgi:hypothetical protein